MVTHDLRRATLRRTIARLDRTNAALKIRIDRVGWLRLAIFLIGLLVTVVAFFAAGAPLFWLSGILTVVSFGGAVGYYRWLSGWGVRYASLRAIKAAHAARMDRAWDDLPPAQSDSTHPLAVDLDLTGARSLLRLLDATTSVEGSERLLAWLLDSEPELATIEKRAKLVAELRTLPLFLDRLRVNAARANGGTGRWRARGLLTWFDLDPETSYVRWLCVLIPLALVNLVLLATSPVLWGVGYVIYMGIYFTKTRSLSELSNKAMTAQAFLRQLSAIFGTLELWRYVEGSTLESLCVPFKGAGRPSIALRRIGWLVTAVSFTHNQFTWLIVNSIVPWDMIFGEIMRRERMRLSKTLHGWLDAWFELEASGSLATFGYLNPAYAFPDLHADAGEPTFAARSLTHPLIPVTVSVANNVTIAEPGVLILITGSNMAGKSTFLRTLGLNLCLAYAGAPVAAASLRAGVFRVFTSIRVSDSVTDGFSYFYAEVRRLKALLTALEADDERPLFFLIDEIFRGTNNRERLIGSRSYINALTGRNGLGVISTHDLELVALADTNAQVQNFHFREDVIDRQMVFDYLFRPGPCPTTNALRIMQLEGLPIEAEAGIPNE